MVLSSADLWNSSSGRAAVWGFLLNAPTEDGYLPITALWAENIRLEDCATAVKLNWQRKIEAATTPSTDLQSRKQRSWEVAVNQQLSRITAIWHGIEVVKARHLTVAAGAR
jgi:hypothetical protein